MSNGPFESLPVRLSTLRSLSSYMLHFYICSPCVCTILRPVRCYNLSRPSGLNSDRGVCMEKASLYFTFLCRSIFSSSSQREAWIVWALLQGSPICTSSQTSAPPRGVYPPALSTTGAAAPCLRRPPSGAPRKRPSRAPFWSRFCFPQGHLGSVPPGAPPRGDLRGKRKAQRRNTGTAPTTALAPASTTQYARAVRGPMLVRSK